MLRNLLRISPSQCYARAFEVPRVAALGDNAAVRFPTELALALLAVACGAPPGPSAPHALPDDEVHVAPDRPPLALVPREGDPAPGFAVAISTEGLAPNQPGEATIALATLLEERLREAWPGVEARAGMDSVLVRGLIGDREIGALVAAVDHALRAPTQPTERPAVKRRLAALAKRPLPDPELRAVAECRGDAYASAPAGATDLDVEPIRSAAATLGRVAFALVGPTAPTKTAADAVSHLEPWSVGAPVAPPTPPVTSRAEWVEAPGLAAARSARAYVVTRTKDPGRAVAAARALGAPGSALIARMGVLDGAPRVDDVTGTTALSGGCVGVTLDFGPIDVTAPATAPRLATAVALAAQEVQAALEPAGNTRAAGRALARQAADPREAAERAAWWALTSTPPVVVVPRREAPPRAFVVHAPGKDKATPPDVEAAFGAALDRAVSQLEKPAVQSRTRVERGQAELWMLFASPCGTAAEVSNDAGLSAAFARSASEALRVGSTEVVVEPWATPDAVGLLAHAPALAGEAPAAHARRVADVVARALVAEPVDERAAARVRAGLRAKVGDPRPRALFALAESLSPGHPSWIFPDGSPDTLAKVSIASLGTRAAALREGPLRAAVLANVDDAQADVAVRTADRWVTRRPEGARACPVPNAANVPRPGMYVVDAPGIYEAYLAFPVANDARDAAAWLAEALSEGGGLLATSVVGAGLARSATARVVGGPFAQALVIHVAATEASLDGAVAQVRALLERVRKGAVTDADWSKIAAARATRTARVALDPRERIAALFADAGPSRDVSPTSARLTPVAERLLREDAMTVVALRPPRPRPTP